MEIKEYSDFSNSYHAELGGRWSWCVADKKRVIALFRKKSDARKFLALVKPQPPAQGKEG